MALSSRGRGTKEGLTPKRLQDKEREASPRIVKTKGQLQAQKQQQGPNNSPRTKKSEQKAAVIYYLSHSGQLEHPHFMEVPIASAHGPSLRLTDVIKKLDSLRGQGMAGLYSWSAKRSYKNGFVWQDLSENDILQPCNGDEYILKGSKLLEKCLSFRSYDTALSSSTSSSANSKKSWPESFNCSGRKNQTLGSFEECKVYKVEADSEFSKKAANAATQTGDEENAGEAEKVRKLLPSLSSRMGSLSLTRSADIRDQAAENDRPSGRIKASAALVQLIACGSKKGKGS